jgi:hypothetical protein
MVANSSGRKFQWSQKTREFFGWVFNALAIKAGDLTLAGCID